MATYFHGSSEIQAAAAAAAAAAADGMQTLYLVNPSYVPFSDTPHQPPSATNTLFLNPAGNALTLSNLSHAQTPNHPHLVGIPLPTSSVHFGPTTSDDPARSSSIHGIVPPAAGVHHYNLWGPVDQNSGQITVAGGAHDMALFRRPPPPVVSPTRQGLSLSLSSQQQQVPYRTNNVDHDMQKQPQVVQAANTLRDDMRVFGNSPSSVSIVSNGVPGMQSVIFGSKYLRAAQELLDEVVNVETAMKPEQNERTKEKMKEMTIAAAGEGSSNGGENENATKHAAELSTAQRQELQMKKAKLLSMLEEVEQRYRQYHQQMQIVVSSFEQAAGFGSAKSYTALALQTISKQFRCLKDAISGQIKATSKNLGEEDCLGAKVEGSRLRYVDHHLRQQRALQQLGMIQHNAWRPQRGLPERAVSVLRAWLFEHFLHPYPKDSDKHLLAKQTGLTRSQVSNWFINARVRLWKPMVEEMYLEEIKEQERKGSGENTSKNEHNKEPGPKSNGTQDGSTSLRMDRVNALQPKQEKPTNQNNTSTSEFSHSINVSASPIGASLPQHTGFNLIVSSDMEGVAQRSPKKPRSHDMQNSPSSILSVDMEMKHGETSREINIGKFGGEGLTKDGYTLITGTANHGGYGSYPMGDIGRFNHEQLTPRFHGNSVSLTLGLTHCENLSLSGNQQNFLSNPSIQLGRRLELGTAEPDFCGINTSQPPHSGTGFENIDIHNRKRFAAELLPDFVV